jgi:hypothetical protein
MSPHNPPATKLTNPSERDIKKAYDGFAPDAPLAADIADHLFLNTAVFARGDVELPRAIFRWRQAGPDRIVAFAPKAGYVTSATPSNRKPFPNPTS